MRARNLHRAIGIILLLPFFGWAITGFVFFIKPGYAGAYEILSPRTYPLNAQSITIDPEWREVRYFRTVLGDHLIVRTEKGWQHLNAATHQPQSMPRQDELRTLLKDAFLANPQRYGDIAEIAGDKVMTTTGVEITIDWNRLSFQQKGKDTDRIDRLYRVHYLQWTGISGVDKVLGFVGLALIVILSTLGAWLAIRKG
jgi:hypothetical protein